MIFVKGTSDFTIFQQFLRTCRSPLNKIRQNHAAKIQLFFLYVASFALYFSLFFWGGKYFLLVFNILYCVNCPLAAPFLHIGFYYKQNWSDY